MFFLGAVPKICKYHGFCHQKQTKKTLQVPRHVGFGGANTSVLTECFALRVRVSTGYLTMFGHYETVKEAGGIAAATTTTKKKNSDNDSDKDNVIFRLSGVKQIDIYGVLFVPKALNIGLTQPK